MARCCSWKISSDLIDPQDYSTASMLECVRFLAVSRSIY